MYKTSTKLGDIFVHVYDDRRLKMSDIFKLMFNKPECTTLVREGDRGFENLICDYGEHKEFFIVVHEEDVYIIASGYTYAEIVGVR